MEGSSWQAVEFGIEDPAGPAGALLEFPNFPAGSADCSHRSGGP